MFSQMLSFVFLTPVDCTLSVVISTDREFSMLPKANFLP